MIDTIVALSTAEGIGATALVRLSGPDAFRILDLLSGGAPRPPMRSPRLVRILDAGGRPIDRALVTLFPGPSSYTGEDVVEISCHGGFLLPATIVHRCIESGGRQAAPGEFTRRAWANGRIDLAQAEAVRLLIEARSEAGRRAAFRQLEGGLSRRISSIRDALVELEVLVVQQLDFPEEDEPPLPAGTLRARSAALRSELEHYLRNAPEGALLEEGALVVLAGPPNAGKSTLFNALVGTERALVSEEPGTTRDLVEASIPIRGCPVRLVDTAGLRTSAAGVEAMGIERARMAARSADLVLFCTPASQDDDRSGPGLPGGDADGDPPRVIRVRTMIDRDPGVDAAGGGEGSDEDAVHVSAVRGDGLGLLRDRIAESLFGAALRTLDGEAPLLLSRRQADSVAAAAAALAAFEEVLTDDGLGVELASIHLRDAVEGLDTLVGRIGSEEVLDRFFARFCVGK